MNGIRLFDDSAPVLCLRGDTDHGDHHNHNHVRVAITPDGDTEFWIEVPGMPTPMVGMAPAHEQLGPLPPEVAGRVHKPVSARLGKPDILRCGAPRRDGSMCRTRVAQEGLRCARHKPWVKRVIDGRTVFLNLSTMEVFKGWWVR